MITSPAGGVGAARCKLPDTAALGVVDCRSALMKLSVPEPWASHH